MKEVFDIIEKEMKEDEKPKLTQLQREANVFVKKMSQSMASKVVVNKEYFEKILEIIRPDLVCENGVKIGAVEIELGKCKKYFFVK